MKSTIEVTIRVRAAGKGFSFKEHHCRKLRNGSGSMADLEKSLTATVAEVADLTHRKIAAYKLQIEAAK